MGLRLTGCMLADDLKAAPPVLHHWFAQTNENGLFVQVIRKIDVAQTQHVMSLLAMPGISVGKGLPLGEMVDRLCRDLDRYLAEPEIKA